MTQTKLSHQLNEVFKFIVVVFIYFIWINYNYNNFINSIIISVVLSAITCYFLTKFFHKKEVKEKIKSNEAKLIKETTTQLHFSDQKSVTTFFCDVFTEKNTPNQNYNNYIILYPNTTYSILVIPDYADKELKETKIAEYYKLAKLQKVNKVLLLSPSFSQTAKLLASQIMEIKFVLYNQDDIFLQLLKPTNMQPEKVVMFKNKQKHSLKTYLLLFLSKRNAKHYFYAALFMIFASLFVTLKNYYLVFSTVLLTLTLLSFYSEYLFSEPKYSDIVKTSMENKIKN